VISTAAILVASRPHDSGIGGTPSATSDAGWPIGRWLTRTYARTRASTHSRALNSSKSLGARHHRATSLHSTRISRGTTLPSSRIDHVSAGRCCYRLTINDARRTRITRMRHRRYMKLRTRSTATDYLLSPLRVTLVTPPLRSAPPCPAPPRSPDLSTVSICRASSRSSNGSTTAPSTDEPRDPLFRFRPALCLLAVVSGGQQWSPSCHGATVCLARSLSLHWNCPPPTPWPIWSRSYKGSGAISNKKKTGIAQLKFSFSLSPNLKSMSISF